jgi:hypothetical protein
MLLSVRAVFTEPDAQDRTALWWFTVAAAGSAVCASADYLLEFERAEATGSGELFSKARSPLYDITGLTRGDDMVV